MPVELDRALTETEDFLRRQLGSRAAREASRRSVQRGIGEVLRRMRRAALVFVLLIGALIIYSIAAPVSLLTWIAAVPTIFLAALITMFWPARRKREVRRAAAVDAAPAALVADTEEWLLERCRDLPRAALPSLDIILARLRELQPNLETLPPEAPLAGETHRLLGRHLPRLVDTYLCLPESARRPGSENSLRLAESLGIVADELTRLSEEASRDHSLGFETQRRFIETRYRDGGPAF